MAQTERAKCYYITILGMIQGQYRTNELVRWRMHFLSDAIAEIEGLLEVNRDFCKKQMAEKASPTLPTNCAVLPKEKFQPSAGK